ncbi:MAG: 3-methyl-2-oxobutanoate hydroxymethyltransferase [Dehalococcoidia bacterium]
MRRSIREVQAYKDRGEKFAMITAYDYPSAKLVDEAGVPLILVGDSLGMVVLGYDSTIPVTMEDIIHHTSAVVRGAKSAIVVADMPFMSYQVSPEEALRNAGRLMKETGATAVKLEGGAVMAPTVAKIVQAGIPVMGHVGLTPQSVNQLGGYKLQGTTPRAAVQILTDAAALQDAGAFAVVLETIPARLGKLISQRLTIPTIGIGAGRGCDGQVQVFHDLLGLYEDFKPRHARRYAELGVAIREATARYIEDVREGSFPGEAESFRVDPAKLKEVETLVYRGAGSSQAAQQMAE